MVQARTQPTKVKTSSSEVNSLAQLTEQSSFIENPDQGDKSKEKSLEEQIYEKWGDEALEKLGANVNTDWNKQQDKE